MILNLGCPKFCAGEECVDIAPHDYRVHKLDAYEALHIIQSEKRYSTIKSKNLLEHLENPGEFLRLCYTALPHYGRLEIITDNAEWLPFYAPFWVRHTGIGAHARNEYALDHCNSEHLMIFTKMHLHNLLFRAGFHEVKIERIWGGARLKAIAIK